MKYSIVASALVAGAAAQTFDVVSAINSLTSDTETLLSDVNAYTGGAGANIVSQAATILSTIESDDTSIQALSAIPEATALSLAGPVQSLGSAVNSAVSALVSKKATFVSAGEGAAVYSALKAQFTAANQLASDLSAKVPSDLSAIAASLAAPISTALASGVNAFADATGAVSSSSATATSATSAASVASSMAASSMAASSMAASSMAASSMAASSMATSSVATMSTTATSSPPVVTGGASAVKLGSGAAALAMLAVLAL